MKKTLAGLALGAAITLGLGSSAAFAGEVKGPPGPDGATGGNTPVNDYVAASICSFSGLNDVVEGFETTRTQSYGTFLVLIKSQTDLETAKSILPSPGMACNPTSGFEE